MPTPEDHAREHIDQALEQAGWRVQDYKSANLGVGWGVVPHDHGTSSQARFIWAPGSLSHSTSLIG